MLALSPRDIDTLEVKDIWFRSLAYPLQVRLEMIRKHFLTQVIGLITANQRFRGTDFELDVTNNESVYTLAICYVFEPEYRFTASMELPENGVVEGNPRVQIIASPGVIFKTERIDAHTRELNDQITSWLTRLGNELASIPIHRQLEEQQLEIQNILEQLDDIPRDYLTKPEAEQLAAKLDDMEARLTKNLQESVTNQAELQTKVETISNDMSVLKEDLKVLSKRGWAKSFVTRTFEWSKDPQNRKLLTTGAQAAKDFLLGSGDPKPPLT